MKLKSSIVSIALALSPCVAVSQENTIQINPNLATALSYIDTDGSALSVADHKGYLENISEIATKIVNPILEKEGKPPIDIHALAAGLGLHNITAVSSSSKQHGGNYVGKTFIQSSDQDKGIWSLWGANDEQNQSQQFAPEDTNLVIETKLKTDKVLDIFLQILDSADPREAKRVRQQTEFKLPDIDMTAKQLMEKLDTRISIAAKITPQGLQQPPAYAVTARIDNIAKLFWPLIEKNAPLESDGNQHKVTLPPQQTPTGPVKISIHIDLDKNYIWFSTDKAHLTSCRDASNAKLATNASYMTTTEHLPKEGNAQIYLSKQLISSLGELMQQGLEMAGDEEPVPSVRQAITSILGSIDKGAGIAIIADKTDDGFLLTSNTPFKMQSGMMGAVATSSVLASIATPLVMNKRKQADRVKNISNLKQLYLALIDYEVEKGKMPDQLDDLTETGTLSADMLKMLSTMATDRGRRKATYIKLDKLEGDKVILHTPSPIDGKHVILKADGSVESIPAGQLQELLK